MVAFVEDRTAFFADFGITATVGAESALVILDEPDHEIMHGMVATTAYAMTFDAAHFTALKYGDTVTINAVAYTVINVNNQTDGGIRVATLQRT